MVMQNEDTAEFYAMIQTRAMRQRKTKRAGLYLTMGLGRRCMRPSLHICLRINAKTLLALCLVDIEVSIVICCRVYRRQVGHLATSVPLRSRARWQVLRHPRRIFTDTFPFSANLLLKALSI